MLAGIGDSVVTQLEQTKLIKKIGRENLYVATEQIGQAGLAAWEAAEKWVEENRGQPVKVAVKSSD